MLENKKLLIQLADGKIGSTDLAEYFQKNLSNLAAICEPLYLLNIDNSRPHPYALISADSAVQSYVIDGIEIYDDQIVIYVAIKASLLLRCFGSISQFQAQSAFALDLEHLTGHDNGDIIHLEHSLGDVEIVCNFHIDKETQEIKDHSTEKVSFEDRPSIEIGTIPSNPRYTERADTARLAHEARQHNAETEFMKVFDKVRANYIRALDITQDWTYSDASNWLRSADARIKIIKQKQRNPQTTTEELTKLEQSITRLNIKIEKRRQNQRHFLAAKEITTALEDIYEKTKHIHDKLTIRANLQKEKDIVDSVSYKLEKQISSALNNDGESSITCEQMETLTVKAKGKFNDLDDSLYKILDPFYPCGSLFHSGCLTIDTEQHEFLKSKTDMAFPLIISKCELLDITDKLIRIIIDDTIVCGEITKRSENNIGVKITAPYMGLTSGIQLCYLVKAANLYVRNYCDYEPCNLLGVLYFACKYADEHLPDLPKDDLLDAYRTYKLRLTNLEAFHISDIKLKEQKVALRKKLRTGQLQKQVYDAELTKLNRTKSKQLLQIVDSWEAFCTHEFPELLNCPLREYVKACLENLLEAKNSEMIHK